MNEFERALALVEKMPVKERASLLYGNGDWHTNMPKSLNYKPIRMHDGPLGVRVPDESKRKKDDIFPPSFLATCFPSPSSMAASWNPELIKKVGEAVGSECVHFETDLLLAPGVNIKRNPLCGRNFEYFSEDPFLAGVLSASFINGVQEKGVGTCLKHFALNNQETLRFTYSAEVDLRTMNELYLEPFRIAIERSNPWSVMCSYNRVNGIYASDNVYLLKKKLREDWKYEGAVISDWGATFDSVLSHGAGLDLEMPSHLKWKRKIAKAVRKGKLPEQALNEAAARVLAMCLKSVETPENSPGWNFKIGHDAGRELLNDSIVLAKNEGFFPLGADDDFALIGAYARKTPFQGSGSSQMCPVHHVNYLDIVREKRPDLQFANGYSIPKEEKTPDEPLLISEAMALAASKGKILLFLGLDHGTEAEGYDRSSMELPERQVALYKSIEAINPNIGIVVFSGAPVDLSFAKNAKAIILPYLGGEAIGESLDDIISGTVSPSGHLPETWPVSYDDVPSAGFFMKDGQHVAYREGVYVGYRYYQTFNKDVMFPFGHGLSYTEFEFSDLKVDKSVISSLDEKINVSFKVRNVGNVPSKCVSQLYIRRVDSQMDVPSYELKGFTKDFIEPGAEREVTIEITGRALASYDACEDAFFLENGKVALYVGSSVASLPLQCEIAISSTHVFKRTANRKSFKESGREAEFSLDDFENELGRKIAHKACAIEEFDLSSTFRDIEQTWIGSLICGNIRKKFADKKEEELSIILDTPLRNVTVGGVPKRCALLIAEWANRKYFKGIWRLIIGK